jgi:hypothetical protein
MIINDKLELVAKKNIPVGIHPLLRVDNRKAWVETVIELGKKQKMELSAHNVSVLAKNWEILLITRYSVLN